MSIDEFIEFIGPHLQAGWIFMDSDGYWYWIPIDGNPVLKEDEWDSNTFQDSLDMFYIMPVDDWRKSLREVGVQ